ncbi:GNAT family N-acetyltransferase [Pseudomonas vanderleydeniana]|uniref:GNAT family N-acetyltransferase n=1 Tax=Pseudomonas vanderleydeniana TaxID=2745495 RepID=A0A9E6PJN4_9PSED|nr:GNAT family N-acetyltransferase [Pseudomonas vanderleydeniana]QXI27759.1 GNAT family N-acetyltransferase [Pseudomonas vanderleydeniana]
MSLSHRPVEARDLPVICGFAQGEEELFFFFPKARYPLTVEQLQGSIDQRSDSTVVELDGEVVGFANFYQWEQGGTCSIGNVVIAPHVRGRGVGEYLVRLMVRLARERHQASEVRLSCFNQNLAGLLFYPKLGFVPYGIEERQDFKGRRVALIQLRWAGERADSVNQAE